MNDAFLSFRQAASRAFSDLEPPSDPSSLGDRWSAEMAEVAPDPVHLSQVISARSGLLEAIGRLQDAAAGTSASERAFIEPVATCPAIDVLGVDSSHGRCQLIIDLGGNDTYTGNAGGTNGGGAAAVIDLAGHDIYRTTQDGGNGGGVAGAGFLFDGGGDDIYDAGSFGTNGGGYFFGLGFLLDGAGNDRYTAGDCGTNGGGCALGSGSLFDLGGNDSYTAGTFSSLTSHGLNGGSDGFSRGVLVDAGGTDVYTDRTTLPCGALLSLVGAGTAHGSGVDRTVAPKCLAGAQIDSTNPVPRPLPAPVPSPSPQPAGSIAGRVTDYSSKTGIAGATVSCGAGGTAKTGSDGRYAIPTSPSGTHRCTASATGYRSKTQDVTVKAGATTTANFALRRDR